MNTIVNITSKPVRQILDVHGLGRAVLLDEAGELRVFLINEPTTVMAMHAATSELEAFTSRVVQISTMASLGPAEKAQLDRVGTAI